MAAFTKSTLLNQVENEMVKIINDVSDIILQNWKAGGHSLTGSFENDLRKEITQLSNKVVGEILLNKYYIYVNEGVAPENIPYTEGSGADHSDYIAGLQLFFQLRAGLSQKEALGAAFGLAKKHKKFGMPLDKSRLGFFTRSMQQADNIAERAITALFASVINNAITSLQSETHGEIIIVL